MDWIKSYRRLEKSGKLIQLSHALGINRCQAIGHLHCLWWWVSENAENGDITKYSPGVISNVSGWDEYIVEQEQMSRVVDIETPVSTSFHDALLRFGFIDESLQGRFIHNWNDHYGEFFENQSKLKMRRKIDRNRLRRWREKKRVSETDVKRVSETFQNPLEEKRSKGEVEVRKNTTNMSKVFKRTHFSIPVALEVSDYAKTIGFELNGQQFCDYYEARGWKIGNTPMKSWKAAVRLWKQNRREEPAKQKDHIVV